MQKLNMDDHEKLVITRNDAGFLVQDLRALIKVKNPELAAKISEFLVRARKVEEQLCLLEEAFRCEENAA